MIVVPLLIAMKTVCIDSLFVDLKGFKNRLGL